MAGGAMPPLGDLKYERKGAQISKKKSLSQTEVKPLKLKFQAVNISNYSKLFKKKRMYTVCFAYTPRFDSNEIETFRNLSLFTKKI